MPRVQGSRRSLHTVSGGYLRPSCLAQHPQEQPGIGGRTQNCGCPSALRPSAAPRHTPRSFPSFKCRVYIVFSPLQIICLHRVTGSCYEMIFLKIRPAKEIMTNLTRSSVFCPPSLPGFSPQTVIKETQLFGFASFCGTRTVKKLLKKLSDTWRRSLLA